MRRRLLRSIIAVAVLAVVLFGVPLGFVASRLYREHEVGRLERRATLAAGALPASGLRGGDPVDLPATDGGMQLAVYDSAGERVIGTGPARGDAVVGAALQGRVVDDHDGAWLAVAVPVHDEEVVVGAARAAVPWDAVDDAAHRSWLLMAAFGAVAVALAGALAAWQSARLVAPVNAVAARATDLGHGDFTSHLDPSGVPELDQAADALNQTATRLGELLARERAFAADVSHQLNTPLTSLRLALESALVTPGADLPAAIEQAVSEVERLETTIATLLALARDDLPADESCSVPDVCDRVTERFVGPLAAGGRPLRVELDGALPHVRCSGSVLEEILTVLIDNAVEHGAGAVSVSGRRVGTGVVVDVADEGAGIEGDSSRVFGRRSPEAAGHGIGLALARSLAEAHGARLELTRARPSPTFSVALAGVSAPLV